MKLTLEKKREISTVLEAKSFPTEKENELQKVISDKLEKLAVFQTPTMLCREYPDYVHGASLCYIGDEKISLNFRYAILCTDFDSIRLKSESLSPDIVEALDRLTEFRSTRAGFKAALEKTLQACSTSKQLTDLIPGTKPFFDQNSPAAQLVPKELVDKVNTVLEGLQIQ